MARRIVTRVIRDTRHRSLGSIYMACITEATRAEAIHGCVRSFVSSSPGIASGTRRTEAPCRVPTHKTLVGLVCTRGQVGTNTLNPTRACRIRFMGKCAVEDVSPQILTRSTSPEMRVLGGNGIVSWRMVGCVLGRRRRRLIVIPTIILRPILVLQLTKTTFHALNVVVQLGRTIHVVIMRIDTIPMHQFTASWLLERVTLKAHGSEWSLSIGLGCPVLHIIICFARPRVVKHRRWGWRRSLTWGRRWKLMGRGRGRLALQAHVFQGGHDILHSVSQRRGCVSIGVRMSGLSRVSRMSPWRWGTCKYHVAVVHSQRSRRTGCTRGAMCRLRRP